MANILIFTSQVYRLGGVEGLSIRLALDIAKQAAMNVHVVVMAALNHSADIATLRELEGAGVRVTSLNRKPRSGIWTAVRSVVRLRRILSSDTYVAIETGLFGTSAIASLASLGLSVAHIVGVHAPYRKAWHKGLKYLLWRWALRLNRRNVYYGVSKAVAADWAHYLPTSCDKIRVIPNCTSPRSRVVYTDIKAWLGLDPSTRLVLSIGRLTVSKGYHVAYAALKPLLVSMNLALVFLGARELEGLCGDDGKMLADVEADIGAEGLGNRVKFVGWQNDIWPFLKGADLLVHVPLREGFGLVLVEAMEAGVPIITTAVDGIPEVLGDVPSPLIAANDVAGLRDAIQAVLSWPANTTSNWRAKAERRVRCFSPQQRMTNMLTLVKRGGV
jgi:glycosyltransferase involved in cell wall biosynthesis